MYGWLSEESADDPARLTRDKVFVIDPIDGTIAFLKNRPHFTICAAVVMEGGLPWSTIRRVTGSHAARAWRQRPSQWRPRPCWRTS